MEVTVQAHPGEPGQIEITTPTASGLVILSPDAVPRNGSVGWG
ncbi:MULTISPECIES: hypothetical protein [Actinomycetes]|nr:MULTISPECIES: hypothetical protein [Actinomycetes]